MNKLALTLVLGSLSALALHAQSVKATIVKTDGKVFVSENASTHDTHPGETVPVGTSISTGDASYATIEAFPGLGIRLNEKSGVLVNKLAYETSGSTVEKRVAEFSMIKGTFVFAMDPKSEKNSDDFKVHVGDSVVCAHGASGSITMENGVESIVSTGGDLSIITSHEGIINLDPDWQYTVGRGAERASGSSIQGVASGGQEIASGGVTHQPGTGPGDNFGGYRFSHDGGFSHDHFFILIVWAVCWDHFPDNRCGWDKFHHERCNFANACPPPWWDKCTRSACW
jgi:hypothetical protein